MLKICSQTYCLTLSNLCGCKPTNRSATSQLFLLETKNTESLCCNFFRKTLTNYRSPEGWFVYSSPCPIWCFYQQWHQFIILQNVQFSVCELNDDVWIILYPKAHFSAAITIILPQEDVINTLSTLFPWIHTQWLWVDLDLKALFPGYHQLCHDPCIPDSVVQEETLSWSCLHCELGAHNPHVHNPFHLSIIDSEVSHVRECVVMTSSSDVCCREQKNCAVVMTSCVGDVCVDDVITWCVLQTQRETRGFVVGTYWLVHRSKLCSSHLVQLCTESFSMWIICKGEVSLKLSRFQQDEKIVCWTKSWVYVKNGFMKLDWPTFDRSAILWQKVTACMHVKGFVSKWRLFVKKTNLRLIKLRKVSCFLLPWNLHCCMMM